MKVKLKTGEELYGDLFAMDDTPNFDLGRVVFLSQTDVNMRQETIMIPYDNVLYMARGLCKTEITEFLMQEEE